MKDLRVVWYVNEEDHGMKVAVDSVQDAVRVLDLLSYYEKYRSVVLGESDNSFGEFEMLDEESGDWAPWETVALGMHFTDPQEYMSCIPEDMFEDESEGFEDL